MNQKIKSGIMAIAIGLGLLYIIFLSAHIAQGQTIGRIQEGQCGVALAELSVELGTNQADSKMIVWIKDHLRQPVANAKVFVYWNTEVEGTETHCTTDAEGKCPVDNIAKFNLPLETDPYPIYVRILRVEHPDKTYKEYDDSKQFWVLCPEELNCD
jgi:hypothetical protein